MLVAFNAAQYATHLEQKTAAQVKDEFMAVLRTIFGARNVPEPVSVRGGGKEAPGLGRPGWCGVRAFGLGRP